MEVSKEINKNLCIICHKRKSSDDDLSELQERGKKRLLAAAKDRKDLRSEVFFDAVVRVEHAFETWPETIFKYHRGCYSDFTNKTLIDRLKPKNISNENESEEPPIRVTRTVVGRVDWQKCILCQESTKEHARQVMTVNMSEKILALKDCDIKLHTRLSGETDLIAKGAVYHSTCFLKATSAAKKFKGNTNESNLALIELCKEVRISGTLGKVIF